MKLFALDQVERDEDFCAIWASIPYSISLIMGKPILRRMAEDNASCLDLGLDREAGGLRLPDRVTNSQNMLILRNRCFSTIAERFSFGAHEVIPARLINKRRNWLLQKRERVHADDYTVVNLLDRFECLDTDRSEMNGNQDKPGVQIFGKYWLKKQLVPSVQDVFRVKGLIFYLFTEPLVDFVRSQGFTNFFFKPVRLSR